MNSSFSKLILLIVLAIAPALSFARNQAVQPIFFEQLEQAQSSAPANSTSGVVTEVTWSELAWEVQNVKTSGIPLVIEFYSANPQDCANTNSASNAAATDECTAQVSQSAGLQNTYLGRVKVVRFNVQQHPSVVQGPDVRVLPTHMFIGSYADSQHYVAIRIWGLMDESALQDVIQQTFHINP